MAIDRERVRAGVLGEADWQFSGRLAPELAAPVYERLARAVAVDDALLDLVVGAHQPNIRVLLAAVHGLLLDGADHPLRAWFATVGGRRGADDDALAPTFASFVAAFGDQLAGDLATRGVQTNEVRRSATIAAALDAVVDLVDGPAGLIELGASAGLNLCFDRYRIRYGSVGDAGDPASPVAIDCEVRGDPPAPAAIRTPAIAGRVGVDLEPVNLADARDRRWLRACVWGDHAARLAQLDAASALVAADPPTMLRGDMVGQLDAAIAALPGGCTPVVFHTNAVNYLGPDERQALVAALEAIGRSRRLVWVSGEGAHVLPELPAPPGTTERFAVPVVVSDVGSTSRCVAVAGVHGGWIEWV